MIMVNDAISDLLVIKGDGSDKERLYLTKPVTRYQVFMHKQQDGVRDHLTWVLGELVQYRMKLVPKYPEADWPDLPNIEAMLPSSKKVEKLKYLFKDKNGKMRGRCVCAYNGGKCCNTLDHRQGSTIIPWCLLPHNGKTHGEWSGLYSCVCEEGIFRTVLTAPEPMAKQGCIVHYDQDRILSVREYARSQGFPDSTKFVGCIEEQYCQVGNAVLPSFGTTLGFVYRVAIAEKERRACVEGKETQAVN
jgi:DNA (cytosine-5)-methyltransferase 1